VNGARIGGKDAYVVGIPRGEAVEGDGERRWSRLQPGPRLIRQPSFTQ
jgi:hypothetical protein